MYTHSTDLEIANFNYLANEQIVIGLSCLMPLLKNLHSLMQFAEKRDVFVFYYVAAIQIFQADVASFYINNHTNFEQDVFWDFRAFVSLFRHDSIPMCWVYNGLDLNTHGLEYLHFTPLG